MQIKQTRRRNEDAEIRNYLLRFTEDQEGISDLLMAPSVFGLKHATEHFKLH